MHFNDTDVQKYRTFLKEFGYDSKEDLEEGLRNNEITMESFVDEKDKPIFRLGHFNKLKRFANI